jgi:hypothetical protein
VADENWLADRLDERAEENHAAYLARQAAKKAEADTKARRRAYGLTQRHKRRISRELDRLCGVVEREPEPYTSEDNGMLLGVVERERAGGVVWPD